MNPLIRLLTRRVDHESPGATTVTTHFETSVESTSRVDDVRALGYQLELGDLQHAAFVGQIVEAAQQRVRIRHAQVLDSACSHCAEATADAHRVLFLREILKVLAGKHYADAITTAIHEAAPGRRDAMFGRIVELLEPDGDGVAARDPAAYLDPSTWPMASVRVENRSELHLRLSLVVTAMLCQEQALAENGLSLAEAVLRTVRARHTVPV